MRERHQQSIRGAEKGFSLLEMVTLLVFITIIGTLGIPQLAELGKSFDRFNARNHLLEDLKRAQAESITEGCRGIVNIVDQGTRYEFGCDYLDYDTTANPVFDKIRFARDLPFNMKVTATGPIIFDSRGQAVNTGGITNNVTLSLAAADQTFATGILLGTGVFTYE
jgi:Tfp pilus assembly protein FimT